LYNLRYDLRQRKCILSEKCEVKNINQLMFCVCSRPKL